MAKNQLTWREALQAVSADARERASNSILPPSGPRDDYTRGERDGTRHAYTVIADEFGYLASLPGREALPELRRRLRKITRGGK